MNYRCKNVTDGGLEGVAAGCPNLRHLDLSGCENEGELLGTDTSSPPAPSVPASPGVQFEPHNLLPMHYSP